MKGSLASAKLRPTRRSTSSTAPLRRGSSAAILQPVHFSDDDLAVEAIKEVPIGGHFFGSPHTLARYESAFYRPLLSDWSNFENWTEAGAKTATDRASELWKKLRDQYVAPPLDPAIGEAIGAYVAKRREEIGA